MTKTKPKRARPSLGSPVTFVGTAERLEEGNQRRWASTPCAATSGIYIGYRHVYNGVYHQPHGSYDDQIPGYLSDIQSVETWLVVINERKQPVRVLPDAVLVQGTILTPAEIQNHSISVEDAEQWSQIPRNSNGVELDWLSGVPLCCSICRHIEFHEFNDDGSVQSKPFCHRGLFLPVKKGTCKYRQSDIIEEPNHD